MYHYISIAVIAALVIWFIGSWWVIRGIEEPSYEVTKEAVGYEIRQYDSYLIAEVTVPGNYDDAGSAGFRLIADYIFGNNVSQSSIAMTAPVLDQEASEPIAMTVPVLDTEANENQRTIAFVMPSEYSLDTLPRPNNPEVIIRQIPAQKVAILRFGWYPTAARIEQKKADLAELIAADGIITSGPMQTARYNPPLSIPFLLRNEIIVPIE